MFAVMLQLGALLGAVITMPYIIAHGVVLHLGFSALTVCVRLIIFHDACNVLVLLVDVYLRSQAAHVYRWFFPGTIATVLLAGVFKRGLSASRMVGLSVSCT